MHKSQNENNSLTLSISKADRSMFLKLANELNFKTNLQILLQKKVDTFSIVEDFPLLQPTDNLVIPRDNGKNFKKIIL